MNVYLRIKSVAMANNNEPSRYGGEFANAPKRERSQKTSSAHQRWAVILL